MQKTKIEWTDYTWNPIKGLCPVDCKLPDDQSYCYARRMYQRFGWDPKLSLDGGLFGSCQDAFSPNVCVYEMLDRIKPESKIFICSTCELFHPKISKEWRDAIFQAIKGSPQHIFQILTKFPQNIDQEMPDNVWLGTTITGEEGTSEKSYELETIKAKVKFISYEPMIENRAFSVSEIDWLILGRLTGCGKKYDPPKDWAKQMINLARVVGIPIFLKNNLKGIWEEPLIQEFPCVAE